MTQRRPRADSSKRPIRRPIKQRPDLVIKGIGVSQGVAIGPAHVIERGAFDIPEYRVPARQVKAEQNRLAEAVTEARAEIEALAADARRTAPAVREEILPLIEAHAQMLGGSRLLRGVNRRIADDRVNAEAAVWLELTAIAEAFDRMQDPYLAGRVQDVREVAERLIRTLTQAPLATLSDVPDGAILVASDLSPADVARLDPAKVAGLVTELGGPLGHTAIMARSLGLPAVLGVPELTARVRAGDMLVLDGGEGHVVILPSAMRLEAARRRRQALARQKRRLARLWDQPSITRDGAEITLQANVDLPLEIDAAHEAGAVGVGLFRSEFLFMNRDRPPNEDEQVSALSRAVKNMRGRPVTIRTIDIGADKMARFLGPSMADEANPALGLRGIRLSLTRRDLLDAQIAAILRVGALGPVRLLLPMVTLATEVRKVRAAMRRIARRLSAKGIAIADPLPPVGAMIETPAAALTADRLAAECDFLSIGTNDLAMYTLAVDRGDEQVAHLYDPLHPAVLRLIQFIVEAARRANVRVNLCGEIAGDPAMSALLIGLGLRELSMTSSSLALVKQRIRAITTRDAERLAHTVMLQTDPGRIATLIDDFNTVG